MTDCIVKEINIAFSFDLNYYRQGYCAVSSLLNYAKNHPRNNVKIIYNLYLLTGKGVGEKQKAEIRNNLNKKYNNFTVQFINMENQLTRAYECRGISIAAYYRLLLHKFIPNLDFIIYSDVDVIFNDDLFEISSVDMTNYYYGANIDAVLNMEDKQKQLREKYEYWNTELKNIGKNYKNSGFLLLNLKKLRDIKFEDFVLSKAGNEYLYQDQDILNIFFANMQDEVYTVPLRYVALSKATQNGGYQRAFEENIISEKDFNEVIHKPAIYHWAGTKPWDVISCLDDIWWNFVKENTPYYRYFKKRYNKLNMIPNSVFEKIFSVSNGKIKGKQKRIIRILGFKFTSTIKNDKGKVKNG